MLRFHRPSADSLPALQADEFLPPMNRWVVRGAWLLVGLLVSGVGLASLIPYQVTVQAIATLRPVEESNLVQAAAGGTVRRIQVQPNKPVKRGDILAELGTLDPSQLVQLQTRQQRLQTYIAQYQNQLDQVNGQLQTLNRQIIDAANFLPTSTQPSTTDLEVEAALQHINAQDALEARRWAAQRDRLQQQQASLSRQIGYDQTTLQAIDRELSKFVILAPTDGTLFKLGLRYPGQTLQSGEVVAQIMPTPVTLQAKAQVRVQDISQVKVGQSAQLRISAYPYPDYGVLTGTVQAIAPDVTAQQDPRTGAIVSYYEVTLQPTRPYLVKGDRQYPLQAGMEARADIIARQDTLLQALFRNLRLWAEL